MKTKQAFGAIALLFWIAAFAPLACAQRVYESPEAAAKAIVAAAKADDNAALIDIFGERQRDVIGTVDKARDRELRQHFAAAAGEYQTLRRNEDGSLTLVVGYQAWPFPIPLVQQGAGWHFDADAGRDELINRRVGENEFAAIDVLHDYVEMQRQYAAQARDGTKVRQFAQKIRSSPGKHDGLYWDADSAKGEEPSPLAARMAESGPRDAKAPYRGYYYRILTRQGPKAPAGAYSYVINGRMVAGYAMIAYPADYGKTGVMSFIVNHYGDIYEKDLGAKTATVAPHMDAYDPDATWNIVER
jgi:hypothetical protein